MSGREVAKSQDDTITLIHWLQQILGTFESDYYFIGTGNYKETESGIVEGYWDLYHIEDNEKLVNMGLSTPQYESLRKEILQEAIAERNTLGSGGAPFIYTIYKLKKKPVKMPNIKSTYGNPYEVYAIDFCSIESTTKRQAD